MHDRSTFPALLLVLLTLGAPSLASAQASILPCGGTETLLDPLFSALDDGSRQVDLAPVFTTARPVTIAGNSYTSMFVNVNGNVTFGGALSTFTPTAVPGLTRLTLAPFFADVDLRNRSATDTNPGDVRYCVDPAANRVTVTWSNTVHYDATSAATSYARVNTFQLVLSPAEVCGEAGIVVEFRYAALSWHAGTASGAAADGRCTETTVMNGTCRPAVAGIDYGDTRTAAQLPGSLTLSVTDTLLTQSNVGTPGVWRIRANPTVIPSCGNGRVEGGCEQCDAAGESATCDVDCTVAACGDGVRNAAAGEACDTGGATPTCDADCSAVRCGDGQRNTAAGEGCDDGNTTAGDGCSPVCQLEECGNSVVDAGETCDTGAVSATCDADCTAVACGDGELNTVAGESCDAGTETASCDGDCTVVACGDGRTNATAGEGCDDGNTTAGDGCSPICGIEVCGNTIVDFGEDCDTGGVDAATCDADCSTATCGDGTRNTVAGEGCDDGNTAAGDGCSPTCQLEECGNSVVDAGEDCDDGAESATCDADCTSTTCGDGTRNATASEACDDGNTMAGDGCSDACAVEACGNSVVDAGERCDDGAETATCNADCTTASCGDAILNVTAGETCDEGAATVTCDADCTVVACGDGALNTAASEACDDGNTTDGDGCSATCTVEVMPDAGSESDAGVGADAGVPDDAATGGRDGGSARDGGAEGGASGGGCSCRTGGRTSSTGAFAMLIALGLVLARRRR
ncbi:nidogen-like domain-containing protein [Sandaracinus amylolyticus]|uniref:nidogen-like domain-containing protein n=1 Tax=Sandaracinus amylolyticus TaxID=927083 RepID=UPI001F386244|nr:nidogen-like domain-containing protein [Sandaracinus amylolyticus]UJR82114.1 Hypothetical protein I5071_41790 [Sandaracinus amylolyticus]